MSAPAVRPRPGGFPLVVLLSAALVAVALGAGLTGSSQGMVAVLVLLGMGTGVVGGMLLATLWDRWRPAGRTPELATLRRIGGPVGAFAAFLGCVLFAAVEAHAVGIGIAAGAPRATASLLAPPAVLGALALRFALRASPGPHAESVDESDGESEVERGER